MNIETEKALNNYKEKHGLNDKEFSFITSGCCAILRAENIVRDNKDIDLKLEQLFSQILKYKNIANILNENIDLSILRFDIVEQYPLGDEEDKFQVIEDSLSLSAVILELEKLEKECEYGLDDQKFFFSVSKKNEWKNYIPIESQYWLSLQEFFELYSLSGLFEIKHSLELEKKLLDAEKEFLEEEIIRTKSKLGDLYSRINHLEVQREEFNLKLVK